MKKVSGEKLEQLRSKHAEEYNRPQLMNLNSALSLASAIQELRAGRTPPRTRTINDVRCLVCGQIISAANCKPFHQPEPECTDIILWKAEYGV